MTDVDVRAERLAKELIQFYKPTVQEFTWEIAAALRERDEEWQVKLDRETRLLREQIRVGDVAFQHLHATSKGNPLPDWVKGGLPNMYDLQSKLTAAEARVKELEDFCNDIGNLNEIDRMGVEWVIQKARRLTTTD